MSAASRYAISLIEVDPLVLRPRVNILGSRECVISSLFLDNANQKLVDGGPTLSQHSYPQLECVEYFFHWNLLGLLCPGERCFRLMVIQQT